MTRWRIGCIGMRYQGSVITREALPFGDVVAICDVDRNVREQARASFGSTAAIFRELSRFAGPQQRRCRSDRHSRSLARQDADRCLSPGKTCIARSR